MRRFFIDPAYLSQGGATITDQEARHIGMVLRLKPGDAVELFDGTGMVYQAEITRIGKAKVETRILSSRHHGEQPPFLSVAQALIKGKNMDLIIQKATELGVMAIHPVVTKHCAITSASASLIDRWQRISLESCKQCDRPTPLLCHPCTPLAQLIARPDAYSSKIFCWEHESTTTLHDLDLSGDDNVLLLIGPEGGFSGSEAEAVIASGFRPVGLGPRTLRAETASIAAMAIVQFLLGNLTRTQ